MLNKTVKEYSNRQRIDINKTDGLTPGSEVIILTPAEYENIKTQLFDLQNKITAKDSELQVIRNQEQNLKELIADAIAPIDKHYQKEIEKKDNKINQLEQELKTLKDKTTQYNLDMQGLNAIEILILRKHKKIITGFNEDIAIIGVDQKIINADAKTIPDIDQKHEK